MVIKVSVVNLFPFRQENLHPVNTRKTPFTRALVTVVCEDTMDRGELITMAVGVSVLLSANIVLLICFLLVSSKEDRGQCKCNLGRLKNRTSLLRKYIEGNDLELQALFAVQALFVQLDYPPGTNVQNLLLVVDLVPFNNLL